MNHIYSLVWNRALRTLQVASELTRTTGGNVANTGAGGARRHPLALACAAALALTAVVAPARAASCTISNVSYANCVLGADGGTGGSFTGIDSLDAGGTGSSQGVNDGGNGTVRSSYYYQSSDGRGPAYSGGRRGNLWYPAAGGAGNGGGGDGATARGLFGGGGGGGGSYASGGIGGGGGGGYASWRDFTYSAGGGGGGGGGLGQRFSGATYLGPDSAIRGGSGGSGGFGYSHGGFGGGGGGGAGVLQAIGGGALTNAGAIAGGRGGDSRGPFLGGFFLGGGGGGGAGVLMAGGTALLNSGAVRGGDGGSGVDGGDGGAGVSAPSGLQAFGNTGSIAGGGGGDGVIEVVYKYGMIGNGGNGGAAVQITGTGAAAGTNSGSLTGGAGGNGDGWWYQLAGYLRGDGGKGGAGADLTAFALTNTGAITGGNGGNGGYGHNDNYGVVGAAGTGGVGVLAWGGVALTNANAIAGGLSGDATPVQADAVDLHNGGNTLTLESGYSFTGNVVSDSGVGASATDGGDTLALGGSASDTFDVSNIVDALPAGATATQYVGFNAFAKTGTGTWTLSNTTTAVTSWSIDGGELSVSNDASLGNASGGIVLDGGLLQVTGTAFTSTPRAIALGSAGGGFDIADASNNFTVAQVLSGSGALTKAGAGMLTLTGDSTFTGGVAINAGAVDVGNNAALGTGTVAMAAGTTLGFAADGLNLANMFTLTGDPTFDVASASQTDTVSGVIADGSAPGMLEKTGAGTLVLTGADTYSGGTTISAGTLQIGNGGTTGSIGSGAIVDNGTLAYDRSDAVALPAGLTGAGALIQQGSGTFTVNGDDSGFAGTTTIKAGTAIIGDASHPAASLGGSVVTVASGATLTGIGTVGGLDLSGTLSPGGSIGTLHVAGDATFEAGSTFNVEASPDGTADQLAVTGATAIKGGNTVVLAQPGNWAPQTIYTIVTAGKSVTGTFAGVSDDQAFLTPILDYSAKDVTLTLERNDIDFGSVATTLNGKGVATGLNGLGFGNALYDAVVKMTADQARVAFDQTADEYAASQQTARVEDSRYIREAMNQRLRNGDADAEAAKQGDSNVTAWAHAWGHWGTTDGDGNAAGLADNGDGLLVGADMPIGAARVGVTGGASRNSLSVSDRNSWGRTTSIWLGAFGGFNVNAFSLRGGIAYAWDQIPTNRVIAFPGYSDRLSGNATGDTLTGFVEGSWTFQFGQASISPFLNLAHTKVETDASTETGGAAALHALDGTTNVSFSTLGARGAIDFAHNLDLHGELGWQHAYGDTTPQRDLQFVAGGSAFTEYGVPIAKNAGLGRIGIGWHQANVAVSADYEGLAGGGVKDQAAKVSVSVTF